jgi:hypothetical protein
MAPDSITIRFPNGSWEYGFMDKVPGVGDTVTRQGATWVVVEVTPLVNDHRDITMALVPDVVDHKPNLGS